MALAMNSNFINKILMRFLHLALFCEETILTKYSIREEDIPVNVLNNHINTDLPFPTNKINSSIEHKKFPNELKKAEVIPIFTKK